MAFPSASGIRTMKNSFLIISPTGNVTPTPKSSRRSINKGTVKTPRVEQRTVSSSAMAKSPPDWTARAPPQLIVQGMQRNTPSPSENSGTGSGMRELMNTPRKHVRNSVDATPHTTAFRCLRAALASAVRSLIPEIRKMPAAAYLVMACSPSQMPGAGKKSPIESAVTSPMNRNCESNNLRAKVSVDRTGPAADASDAIRRPLRPGRCIEEGGALLAHGAAPTA
mmetsp:Transcript_26059/g.59450  ORF Transcript_26059/g.59450 Transcript_26059/m.59450 type:complete len:224 (-) Transcript_26059:228-899(-)